MFHDRVARRGHLHAEVFVPTHTRRGFGPCRKHHTVGARFKGKVEIPWDQPKATLRTGFIPVIVVVAGFTRVIALSKRRAPKVKDAIIVNDQAIDSQVAQHVVAIEEARKFAWTSAHRSL